MLYRARAELEKSVEIINKLQNDIKEQKAHYEDESLKLRQQIRKMLDP